jgi:crotonobetainyl-CoA:carnitine CoA-transferase CaiB-like acyl-CoA transferase
MGNGLAAGQWPQSGRDLVTGGTPRYNIYRTADDRFVAAAPLEEKFWSNFLAEIGLDEGSCDDLLDPDGVTQAGAARIATDTAENWRARFAGKDVCANIVETVEQAMSDANFKARGVFDHQLAAEGRTIPALPMPIAPHFRAAPSDRGAPLLGEANGELLV